MFKCPFFFWPLWELQFTKQPHLKVHLLAVNEVSVAFPRSRINLDLNFFSPYWYLIGLWALVAILDASECIHCFTPETLQSVLLKYQPFPHKNNSKKAQLCLLGRFGSRERRRVEDNPREVPGYKRCQYELCVSSQPQRPLTCRSPGRRHHRPHPGPKMFPLRLPQTPPQTHQQRRSGNKLIFCKHLVQLHLRSPEPPSLSTSSSLVLSWPVWHDFCWGPPGAAFPLHSASLPERLGPGPARERQAADLQPDLPKPPGLRLCPRLQQLELRWRDPDPRGHWRQVPRPRECLTVLLSNILVKFLLRNTISFVVLFFPRAHCQLIKLFARGIEEPTVFEDLTNPCAI